MKEDHNAKNLIKTVMLTGQIMLENGAEIYRVEDTMERICAAAGVANIDTYATPTGIFVSIVSNDENYFTGIKRVKQRNTNLYKIFETNNISRQFVRGDITLSQALALLEQLQTEPAPSNIKTILAAGFSSGLFALLFAGTLVDACIAAIAGALVQFMVIYAATKNISYYLTDIAGGMLSALIAIISSQYLHFGSLDKIVIGAIIPLLPGLAITSAIRDTIYGDLVSGTTRAVEALLIAVSIASGVGVVLKIWFTLAGGIHL